MIAFGVEPPDLRLLPFFARLPDAALTKLRARLKWERYERGELLAGKGRAVDALTLVCEGRLGIAHGVHSESIGPGSFFGADAALLGPPEQHTIEAVTDVVVGKISRACIDDLLRNAFSEALGPAAKTEESLVCSSNVDPTAPGRPLIGLALSGGGAKAFAHLGVLKVLSEAGIRIDVVAGTSAGAIAGAMCCAGKPVPEMFALANDLRRRVLRREGMWDFLEPPAVGLIRGERTQALYDQILDGAYFEQLGKPLAIPAADMVTGEQVVFQSGRISEAIRASAGIPGLFAPWAYAGRYLAEGGLVNPLPIDLARQLGADIVIACDVTGPPDEIQGETLDAKAPNFLGLIAARASAILHRNTGAQSPDAEIVIRPEVQEYDVLDYPMAEELIELGETAARAMLPRIRKTLGMNSVLAQSPRTAVAAVAPAGHVNA